MSIWMLHVAGAILAVLTLFLTRALTRSPGRALAVALLAAALIYVGFAVSGGAGLAALSLELIGVGIFGSIAWAGVRRSRWWLVVGWALHAGWDIGLHVLGPGVGTAPEWYAHLCFSFDLVVAGYLAFQLLQRRASNFSKSPPLRGAG